MRLSSIGIEPILDANKLHEHEHYEPTELDAPDVRWVLQILPLEHMDHRHCYNVKYRENSVEHQGDVPSKNALRFCKLD